MNHIQAILGLSIMFLVGKQKEPAHMAIRKDISIIQMNLYKNGKCQNILCYEHDSFGTKKWYRLFWSFTHLRCRLWR